MRERLQKLISASGLMSRRVAEAAIEEGRVSVNGKTAALGDRADPEQDRILVDGKPLSVTERKRYILLNKPRGYVTTLSDEKGRRNVTQLLTGVPERVYPVGRLDMYSEGLLLLTNDGDFANRVMHPSHEIVKVYETWVSGERIEEKAALLRRPMELDGYRISPAEVSIEQKTENGAVLQIRIREGRNRQVRKMCGKVGLKVSRLCRIREGELSLGELQPGQWRELDENEIKQVLGI